MTKKTLYLLIALAVLLMAGIAVALTALYSDSDEHQFPQAAALPGGPFPRPLRAEDRYRPVV